MQLTPKLNLKKPDLTDSINVQDLNDNMDVLDTAVSELQEGSASIPDLETNDKTLAGSINEIKQTVNDVETNAKEYTDQQTAAIDTKLNTHIKDDEGHTRWFGNSGGSANAKTLTTAHYLPTTQAGVPVNGASFRFFNMHTNTGATTISITHAGGTTQAYPIFLNGGQLKANDLPSGIVYTLCYAGGAFQLQGKGGGYSQGALIKAQDLVNRPYIVTNEINPVDINNLSNTATFFNSEIATVNGVEYAFAWANAYSLGQIFYCWEVLTGRLVWKKNVPIGYAYGTRIIVYNDKLYVGVYGHDETTTQNSYGLEVLNPVNGARISLVFGTVPSSYADRAADICLWDNGATKEVLLLATNYSNGYSWIARFNPTSGAFLGVSANLGGNHTDIIPHRMQTVGDYIFLASSKCMYQHKGASFSYIGKVPFTYEYQMLGLAANNAGGISVIHVYGIVYVYSTSLAQLSTFSVNGPEPSGLSIKGDLMSCATKSGVHMYRLAADAKSASFIETIAASCDVSNVATVANVGFSENAVIPPINASRTIASVLSKTLKLQR
ncbi:MULTISPECIES: hypothetical protein [Lysinibacillus]|uniref:hypothetical protein n=1 Tax=Lysinibacillus TaxID=400634 RepID=UPI0004D43BE2|nr:MULTISPECIES: hypothetical protein [Lysinibacillus]AJK89638.1 hypothetical protein HR49_22040 [Lysinibacillus fusiformis]KHK54290.1 hypothetical protein PI85_05650 [Lysinibacillus sp. A1]